MSDTPHNPQAPQLLKPLDGLTLRESEAYQKYQNSGKPGLAPSTAAGLFALYLQGKSTEEISTLNPSLGLGLIVKTKVEGNWDILKQEHINSMFATVRETVQNTTMSTIRYLCDGIAAFQKSTGDRYAKYLQTGDEKLLFDSHGDELLSFKRFKDMVEMVQVLTGAQQKVTGEIVHTHQTNNSSVTIEPLSAEAILKRLDDGLKKK